MADAPTANEIKTQLKTLLTPVIGTSLTRKVKIIDYLALAFLPEGEDPAILRSSLDTSATGGRINCLMISEDGFGQELQPPKRDSTLLLTQPRGRVVISRRFRLTYFYQFGGNSENQFSDTVELIRTTLNDAPKLGFAVADDGSAGEGERIGHEGLQVMSMLPEDFASVVHVADMLLTVRVIEGLG